MKNIKAINNVSELETNLRWTCKCKKQFPTRRLLVNHHKECDLFKKLKQKQNKLNFTCDFCKKSWNTTKSGYKIHIKYCKCNPNHICSPLKGTHISEETRHKLQEHAGGYRKGSGSGKRGYYKGIYCMSSWELAWVVYQFDHNKKVEQCKERFLYRMNGKDHYYTPDFKIEGIYYEIKNYHRPDTDFKIKYFPLDKKLILIEGDENKLYLNYVIEKYGESFYEILYEKKDYKNKKVVRKLSYIDNLKLERWNIIQNSNIDFSKFGWISKISKLFGIVKNADKYIKRNYLDFFEKECFKSKSKVKTLV